MLKIWLDVLSKEQRETINMLKNFATDGVLGGGSGLAMQLKHRRSYDFDIFTFRQIHKNFLLKVNDIFGKGIKILVDTIDELSFITEENVKISFIYFPFQHQYKIISTFLFPIFNWHDIILDKAYSIGRRGEYRDYVDLFFGIKNGYKLKRIISQANKKFVGAFSTKLFLEQLIYFEDLKDFSIEFINKHYQPKEIEQFFRSQISKLIYK